MNRNAFDADTPNGTRCTTAPGPRTVVGHIADPVEFRLRGDSYPSPLGRLIDVPTFNDAPSLIGDCDVQWREGASRRETCRIVVDLTLLEFPGSGSRALSTGPLRGGGNAHRR